MKNVEFWSMSIFNLFKPCPVVQNLLMLIEEDPDNWEFVDEYARERFKTRVLYRTEMVVFLPLTGCGSARVGFLISSDYLELSFLESWRLISALDVLRTAQKQREHLRRQKDIIDRLERRSSSALEAIRTRTDISRDFSF